MIRVSLLIVASIALSGFLDANTLKACQAAGNTPETCYSVMK